jgi:hypothetical protein
MSICKIRATYISLFKQFMIHALLLVLVPRQPKYQPYSFNLIGRPVGPCSDIASKSGFFGSLFERKGYLKRFLVM